MGAMIASRTAIGLLLAAAATIAAAVAGAVGMLVARDAGALDGSTSPTLAVTGVLGVVACTIVAVLLRVRYLLAREALRLLAASAKLELSADANRRVQASASGSVLAPDRTDPVFPKMARPAVLPNVALIRPTEPGRPGGRHAWSRHRDTRRGGRTAAHGNHRAPAARRCSDRRPARAPRVGAVHPELPHRPHD